MLKRFAIGLSTWAVALTLLAMTLSAARLTAQPAPVVGSRVDLNKAVDNPWPHVGEIVTFSLRFANVSNEIRMPIQVRVADPNPASLYLRILSPTITGDAWYSPTIDGVVWEDMLFWGDEAEVTFQVEVVSMPDPAPARGYLITNTVTIVDLTKLGTLPEQRAEAALLIGAPRVYLPVIGQDFFPSQP